jgi:toxin HigB-1
MIQNFKCAATKSLFIDGKCEKKWETFEKVALRKLDYLKAAVILSDLKAPLGNKLEALKGNRQGQHSIRINDQYRICFIWLDDEPNSVEIVDYHK